MRAMKQKSPPKSMADFGVQTASGNNIDADVSAVDLQFGNVRIVLHDLENEISNLAQRLEPVTIPLVLTAKGETGGENLPGGISPVEEKLQDIGLRVRDAATRLRSLIHSLAI